MEHTHHTILKPDRIDRILEVTAWALLMLLIATAMYAYSELPEIIPVHFDIHGRPDNYGDKSSIFLLPVVGALLLIVIHMLLNHSPAAKKSANSNSPRARQKYRIATRMIRIVKVVVLVDFIVITATIWLVAMGRMPLPGVWFIFLVLGIVLLPIAIALWRTAQH